MREEIVQALEDPVQLEKLYRENKSVFKNEFNQLYPEIQNQRLAGFWNARLNYEGSRISWGSGNELIFIILASLLAGFIAKIPDAFDIDYDFFYPRNIGFIFLPLLTIFFAWKNSLSRNKIILISLGLLFSAYYINNLPDSRSDTLILSCIHLPLFLWSVLGYSFVGGRLSGSEKRLDYLRYNGDLLVITTIILIAGAIMTGITIGLFELINISIEELYFKYVVVFGLAASPILGTYVVQTNPQLVNKVSPVIARIFSPLVLITLAIYLVAIVISGKDPYNDRDFLMLFNLLLIGVIAIILFSVAETSRDTKRPFTAIILFLLALLTIIVNGVALSAILFRISEWGITPNRLAVLGGNVLILINLLIVSYKLARVFSASGNIEDVENSIASYLPIYSAWTVLVTFVFPMLFGFE